MKQVTFGAGLDLSPMPDPSRKGVYFVNGKQSGTLTLYHIATGQSSDLVTESTTQPVLSFDGQHVVLTVLGRGREKLWISDITGRHRLKIASSSSLETLGFSPDGSQLAFTDGAGADKKLYIAKSDGSRLWHVRWSGAFAGGATWSPDSKIFYFSGYESDPAKWTAWTADIDDLEAKVFLEECGAVEDTSPDGKFLVSTGPRGAGMGIGQISISDRQCCVLIPDIKPAMVHFSSDAKSILYLDASRGETIIYRQPWQAGKVSSSVQVALKIPFASRQDYSGNAYEFSKDLSTIVYTGLAAKRTCICFAGK